MSRFGPRFGVAGGLDVFESEADLPQGSDGDLARVGDVIYRYVGSIGAWVPSLGTVMGEGFSSLTRSFGVDTFTIRDDVSSKQISMPEGYS